MSNSAPVQALTHLPAGRYGSPAAEFPGAAASTATLEMDADPRAAEYASVVDTFHGSVPQVWKHNRLIEARYQLSTRASKIFALAVAKLRGRPSASLVVEFTVEEFATLCGVNKHALYGELYELTKSLMRNQPVISIPRVENADTAKPANGEAAAEAKPTGRRGSRAKNDAFTHVMLWPKISYKGEGSIEVHFHEDLRPYLLELTREFTRYDLLNVMRLSSSHTMRLYELLKERLYRGEWHVQYPELKELLGLAPEQYPSMGNFKQRILDPAQKEILEVTDVYFHYKLLKTGRKYTGLRFHISSRKAPHQLAAEAAREKAKAPVAPASAAGGAGNASNTRAAAPPVHITEVAGPGQWEGGSSKAAGLTASPGNKVSAKVQKTSLAMGTVDAPAEHDEPTLQLISKFKTGADDIAYNGQWDAEQFVAYYRYAVQRIRPHAREKAPADLVEMALVRFREFPALREGYLERVDLLVQRRLHLPLDRFLDEGTLAHVLAADYEWVRRHEDERAGKAQGSELDQMNLPLAAAEALVDASVIEQLQQYLQGPDAESALREEIARRLLRRLHPAVDVIFDYWNTLCPHAPVKVRSENRKDRFALRLAESEVFRSRWREAITQAGRSKFLRGENRRNQKFNIHCLLNDGFLEKLADGEFSE